jgi:hypothetical protein
MALKTNAPMNTLYDSDSFVVVSMLPDAPQNAGVPAGTPVLVRHGFEIVDKRSGKEVYLDGPWAELFQQRIVAWQKNTPTQEEVEHTLEGYAELAQNPVVLH